MVESPDYDESLLQSITDGMDCTIDSWILDTGCDCHMCPNRDIFDTCTSCEDESIYKSNNMECKIIGIRIVRIKMFDRIVRTLISMMNVSELQRNLISLVALDAKRCKCTITGKVVKGTMVIMKGHLVRSVTPLKVKSGLCVRLGPIKIFSTLNK